MYNTLTLPSLPPVQIREAAQALLQAELRRVGVKGRKELVSVWSTKLTNPTAHGGIEEPKNKSGVRETVILCNTHTHTHKHSVRIHSHIIHCHIIHNTVIIHS